MKINLAPARAWWRGRSVRERRLLAVLAVIATLTMAWYGVLTPLRALEGAAAERLQHAAAVFSQVDANARDIAALEKAGAAARAGRGAVDRLVLETAAAGGVGVSRQQIEAGAFTVWIDAVEPEPLFAWLGTLQDVHGLAPDSVTVMKAEAGGLEAEVTFTGVDG